MTKGQIQQIFPYLKFQRCGKTLFGKSRVMAYTPGNCFAIRADGQKFDAFADGDTAAEAYFLLAKKLIWAGFRTGQGYARAKQK